jgi:hypothetical protein
MIAIPGVTTKVGAFAAANYNGAGVSAKFAALVVVATVMWLIVLAIITLV